MIAALIFSLPFVLTGICHALVMRGNLLSGLAKPMDFQVTLRHRRLFGDNKTVRGVILILVGLTAWTPITAVFIEIVPSLHEKGFVDFEAVNPFAFGALSGLGWVLGELANSFIKRQLLIAPGQQGKHWQGPIFWLVDQFDGVIGAVLLTGLIWNWTWSAIAWILAAALVLRLIAALAMVSIGLKTRVG